MPTLSFMPCLLLNGRENNIENWDLKFLCAFVFVLANIFKFNEPVKNVYVEYNGAQIIANSSVINADLTGDCLIWCEGMKGKEHTFLSTFHISFFNLFAHHTSTKASAILDSLHAKFFGQHMDKYVANLMKTGPMKPLTCILQLLCDGYLCNTDSLNRIEGLNVKGVICEIDRFLERIDVNDIPKYRKTTLSRFAGGTFVCRGECLIINQTFTSDSKLKRTGTEKDEAELLNLWNKLGCKENIRVERDLSK